MRQVSLTPPTALSRIEYYDIILGLKTCISFFCSVLIMINSKFIFEKGPEITWEVFVANISNWHGKIQCQMK